MIINRINLHLKPKKLYLNQQKLYRRYTSLAQRLYKLGTETAYSVSAESNALAAQGKKIYSFHIGDLNFPSPPTVVEATKRALDEQKTGYCPALGIPKLRKVVADFCGTERKIKLTSDHVSIQPGGKPIIEKFILTTMNPGDEVLYPSPGYPIFESLVTFYGGKPVPYFIKETSSGSLQLDMRNLRKSISPNTKLLIYNNMHNPTGYSSSPDEMADIARLAVDNNLWVLSDEAYFHISYGDTRRSIISYPGMSDRTVVLTTSSKTWSMTGWRLGAALASPQIINMFGKLSTNFEGCTSHFIQVGALECYSDQAQDYVKSIVSKLDKRRILLHRLINNIPGFRAHLPICTFYLWVNVTKAFQILKVSEYEEFRQKILAHTGVSFCSRNHFGTPLQHEQNKYIRLAYSGISEDDIIEACEILNVYMWKHISK